jgi:hypothetical protein
LGNVSAAGIKEKSNNKNLLAREKGLARFCLKLSGA